MSVNGNDCQMKDGWGAEGDIHCMVTLKKKKKLFYIFQQNMLNLFKDERQLI